MLVVLLQVEPSLSLPFKANKLSLSQYDLTY